MTGVTLFGRLAVVGRGEFVKLLRGAGIEAEGLDANISIKPTMLGLKIDEDLCADNVTAVVRRAAELGSFVRIDMEDHTCTDATLRLYRRIQGAHPTAVGVVLQSYLHRTTADVADLLPLSPNIRMCKGIYREPRAIAWEDFETIRANFIYNVDKLLSAGAYVGIATHDPHLVWAGMAAVDRLQVDRDRYEFQMLLGVAGTLRRKLVTKGHPLRVYVPFGELWYEYSIRRLRENPNIAGHIIRNLFSRP